MSLADNLTTIAENVPKVYDAGKQKEQSDFWDIYQKKGNQVPNYTYAFAYNHWTDDIYNPKYNFYPTYSCNSMYYNSQITDTKMPMNLRFCSLFNSAFLTSKIKTIRKLYNVQETLKFTDTFKGCSELENIEFEGTLGQNISFADSPLLTEASLANIIDCLKDNSTTGVSRTLTLHQTSRDKLTEAQVAEIERKGWSLAV